MRNPTDPITVLGAGSWGTALALLLARNDAHVTLWGRDATHCDQMRRENVNERYLPDQTFPATLRIAPDLASAVSAARTILIAVPSHAFAGVVRSIVECGVDDKSLGWATKGFEPGSGRLLHEVMIEEVGKRVDLAVLSGPTFAGEIARGLPGAVTIGSRSASFADALAERFRNDRFRVYTSDDLIGIQVGGGTKNVMAIAAGIADGLGFGANTRAALITRGMAELSRLGVALGGKQETFMGLAGLGDLILTCTDDQSRNRRCGLVLGRGGTLDDARNEIGQVIEGVTAAREVSRLAATVGVEMPITEQVEQVLYAGRSPEQAVQTLLTRAARSES